MISEILLVEDNDDDAELTLRALREGNLVNVIQRVRDGLEALEYVFRQGTFEHRAGGSQRSYCSIFACREWTGLRCCRPYGPISSQNRSR